MNLSLDDFIKNKKINGAPLKKFNTKKAPHAKKIVNEQIFKETIRFTDARSKIIQRNRAKIRDARDKLAEITRANGDARKKILQKQRSNVKFRHDKPQTFRDRYLNSVSLKSRKISSITSTKPPLQHLRILDVSQGGPRIPDLVEVPRGYIDYDNMERLEEEEYASDTRLSRTVKNDITSYENRNSSRSNRLTIHPAPRRLNSWGSLSDHFDPFDVYEVPQRHREHRLSSDLSLPLPKSVLRANEHHQSPIDAYQRRYIPDSTSHLSYKMRSRLEQAPDPHASMGIFANPSISQTSASGYRIVVSNLHNNVSQSDIKELFEDIDELYDSHIVRPGIAEVIYKSLSSAEKAVDTYHNRQLDGQPMKCMLVNPRASNKPTAPAINNSSLNSRHISGKTPLEIDIDALHKVLFRRN